MKDLLIIRGYKFESNSGGGHGITILSRQRGVGDVGVAPVANEKFEAVFVPANNGESVRLIGETRHEAVSKLFDAIDIPDGSGIPFR